MQIAEENSKRDLNGNLRATRERCGGDKLQSPGFQMDKERDGKARRGGRREEDS